MAQAQHQLGAASGADSVGYESSSDGNRTAARRAGSGSEGSSECHAELNDLSTVPYCRDTAVPSASPGAKSAKSWRLPAQKTTRVVCDGIDKLVAEGGLLSFQIRAKEANVNLSDAAGPCYALSLSNYQGTCSFLERRDAGRVAHTRQTAPILNCETFVQMWISVHREGSLVAISCGTGAPCAATLLLHYNDAEGFASAPRLEFSSFNGVVVVRDVRVGSSAVPPSDLGASLAHSGQLSPQRDADGVGLPTTLTDRADCVVVCDDDVHLCSALVLVCTSAVAEERMLEMQPGLWQLDLQEGTCDDFASWYRDVSRGLPPPPRSRVAAVLDPFGELTGRIRSVQWRRLFELSQRRVLTDFQICIHTDAGEVTEYAHSAVLCQLGYFQALLRSGCSETQTNKAEFDLSTSTGAGTGAIARAFFRSLYCSADAGQAELREAMEVCGMEEVLAALLAMDSIGAQRGVEECQAVLCGFVTGGAIAAIPDLTGLLAVADLLALAPLRTVTIDALRRSLEEPRRCSVEERVWQLAALPSSCLCELLRGDSALSGLHEDVLYCVVALHCQQRAFCDDSDAAGRMWVTELANSVRLAHLSPQFAEHVSSGRPGMIAGLVRRSCCVSGYLRDLGTDGAHADQATDREAVAAGGSVSVPRLAHLCRARKGKDSVTVISPNPSCDGVISRLRAEHAGVNLVRAGVVAVTSSSAKNPRSQGSGLFVTRGLPSITAFPTRLVKEAFVEVDLLHRRLSLTDYMLSHDSRDFDYLRAWDLLGYDDQAQEWVVLDSQRGATNISAPFGSAVFAVATPATLSRVRVVMRGPNSSGTDCLVLGKVELFGTLAACQCP